MKISKILKAGAILMMVAAIAMGSALDMDAQKRKKTGARRAPAKKTAVAKKQEAPATPKAIDMGLSVKWCDMDLGGTLTKAGPLIAWDETPDPATAKMGSDWRLPTKKEFDELRENCRMIPQSANGKLTGVKFISKKNGNSIMFNYAPYFSEVNNQPGSAYAKEGNNEAYMICIGGNNFCYLMMVAKNPGKVQMQQLVKQLGVGQDMTKWEDNEFDKFFANTHATLDPTFNYILSYKDSQMVEEPDAGAKFHLRPVFAPSDDE